MNNYTDFEGPYISIHAPARGATWIGFNYARSEKFQSTPPRGERLHGLLSLMELQKFQSTPPRGERPMSTMGVETEDSISIHAPARGATGTLVAKRFASAFQSTPPRGERPACRWSSASRLHFNPRPREGSDRIYSTIPKCGKISIHAPARGATIVTKASVTIG